MKSYYMSKKFWPFLNSESLYKSGQDFLDKTVESNVSGVVMPFNEQTFMPCVSGMNVFFSIGLLKVKRII